MDAPRTAQATAGGTLRTTATLATGGTGAALAGVAAAATACCSGPAVAPVVVAVLGAGGAAWAAGLKPYSGWLLAGSGLLLAGSFWLVYRPGARCTHAQRQPLRTRLARHATVWTTWGAAVIWGGALLANLFLAG